MAHSTFRSVCDLATIVPDGPRSLEINEVIIVNNIVNLQEPDSQKKKKKNGYMSLHYTKQQKFQ